MIDLLVSDMKIVVESDLRKAIDNYLSASPTNYAEAVVKGRCVLGESVVSDNPRLVAEDAVLRLLGIYCTDMFDDVYKKEEAKKLEPPVWDCDEQRRQGWLYTLVTGQNTDAADARIAMKDLECSVYHLLDSIKKCYKKGSLQTYFGEFLKMYCADNRSSIPKEKDSLKQLIDSDASSEKFSESDEAKEFVIKNSTRDIVLNIMLVKYFGAVGDIKYALKAGKSAKDKFRNVPWFVYKFAEIATSPEFTKKVKEDKSIEGDQRKAKDSLEALLKRKKEPAKKGKPELVEQDKVKLLTAIGDFYFNTATEYAGFEEAHRSYNLAREKAEKKDSLSEKIERAVACASAARRIEEKLSKRELMMPTNGNHKNGKTTNEKEKTTQEYKDDWEVIRDSYQTILEKLYEDGHPYREAVTDQMLMWVKECRGSLKAKNKKNSTRAKLLKSMMEELKEEREKAANDYERGLIDSKISRAEELHALEQESISAYEVSVRPLEENFYSIFGGKAKFLELIRSANGK